MPESEYVNPDRPSNEEARLQALRRYEILDTDPEKEFDDLTLLASHICGAPVAMISLIDENRQWFKSKVGMTANETSRDIAFCAHGILQAEMFVIKDAQADERFAANPLVTGNPRIRFYAGAPLVTSEGHALGMICVNDQVPRELSSTQMEALQALSRQVVAQLELRRSTKELRQTVADLEKTQEELRWRTAFFEAKFDTSIDGVLVVDNQGRKVLQNKQMNALWKIPQHIIDSGDDQQRIEWLTGMAKNPEEFIEKVRNFYANPDEINRDEIELKDGTILDRYSSPVIGKDGISYGRIVTFRDITESRRATQQLDRMFALSPDMIFTAGFDGYFKRLNPAFEQILGYSREELLAEPFINLVHPDEQTAVTDAITRTIEDGKLLGFESRVRCKDGAYKWLQINSVSVPVEQLFYVVARDITERKKTERQLNVQYAVSRTLVESSTVEQVAPRILQVICENLGWDIGEMWSIDQRIGLLRCVDMWSVPNFPADEFKRGSRQMTFARGTGLPGRVWDSGQPTWIHDVVQDKNFPRSLIASQAGLHGAFGFPILIENKVDAVIGLFSREPRVPDDSLLLIVAALGNQIGQFFQRKRLEDQLFLSQKMETVGKLAGGVAHEFNSIMTAIIGQSEMLLDDLPSEDPLSMNALEIRNAADRAAALTRQLLAYGRKQILQPEALNLNTIIANMEGMFRNLLGGDVDVRILPNPDLKPVNADAGQIEQVIMNMAMNAREAMPYGGKLTLETGNITFDEEKVGRYPELKPGDYVMLAISDTGIGMGDEVKERIFEPFFSTKAVGQGTGLGLATCYGIIKQSGGHISVYSEKDRGTTFKIYLPQMREDTKARFPSRESSHLPHGTETILLVEDDPALRNMASTLLGRLGYTVLATANGVEALNLMKHGDTKPVHLLFTDVVMPQMSGKELSDRVLELYPGTKILFTSAYTENAIVHQGVLNPGVALLQKPFAPSALAHKVREVLDGFSKSPSSSPQHSDRKS